MRVKVGNRWFEAEPNQPIAVELTSKDRENINNMHPEATRYALFAEDGSTVEAKRDWIAE